MEQLPLTFVQASIEPEIMECIKPAFNFTKLSSSNGRLAFTKDKLYWLPDEPIALMDQGWFITYPEIDSCGKYGVAGFIIKLVDGKELRFSNVGAKMREQITAAVEEFKGKAPAATPETEAPKAEAAPETAAEPEAAAEAQTAAEDAKDNKVMGILAYLGILVLIPLFLAKESKFARFHVNQGLILLILSIVVYVIGLILPASLMFIVRILDLAILILAIIGIYNVIKGQTKELPFVGKYTIIK